MTSPSLPIWDLPVRLFHWSLLLLCAVSWWSGEEGGVYLKYHFWSGYAVLTLLLFRLLWGFCGSHYARFAEFLRGPRAVWQSLPGLLDRTPLRAPGHNPLGGWMVMALLIVLLVQVSTGLFSNDDILYEGPLFGHVSKALSDRLTGIHQFNFKLLLGLVSVHMAAIAWHRWRKGEALVAAMVSGRKPNLDGRTASPFVGLWRAGLALLLAGGIVAGIVNF